MIKGFSSKLGFSLVILFSGCVNNQIATDTLADNNAQPSQAIASHSKKDAMTQPFVEQDLYGLWALQAKDKDASLFSLTKIFPNQTAIDISFFTDSKGKTKKFKRMYAWQFDQKHQTFTELPLETGAAYNSKEDSFPNITVMMSMLKLDSKNSILTITTKDGKRLVYIKMDEKKLAKLFKRANKN